MSIEIKFVLCFLTRGDKLLMLKRVKAPNKGKWNCVGGHIEIGETPLAACIREVREETGFVVSNPTFHGLLTWEGFEISEGGLYLFSAPAPDGLEPTGNDEGRLEWKRIKWVIRSDAVVDNLHIVTPLVLKNSPAAQHHFIYKNGSMIGYKLLPLPERVVAHAVQY